MRFSYRQSNEGARSERKNRKYFLVQTEQTRLIKRLLYSFWFIFFSVFSAVFAWSCWFHFMFTPLRHSFSSLIDFKKNNTNVPGRVIVRNFPTNILNRLLCSFKSTQKFSHKNLPVWRKTYCTLTVLGGQYAFFWTARCAMTWKQAQPYNKGAYSFNKKYLTCMSHWDELINLCSISILDLEILRKNLQFGPLLQSLNTLMINRSAQTQLYFIIANPEQHRSNNKLWATLVQ